MLWESTQILACALQQNDNEGSDHRSPEEVPHPGPSPQVRLVRTGVQWEKQTRYVWVGCEGIYIYMVCGCINCYVHVGITACVLGVCAWCVFCVCVCVWGGLCLCMWVSSYGVYVWCWCTCVCEREREREMVCVWYGYVCLVWCVQVA